MQQLRAMNSWRGKKDVMYENVIEGEHAEQQKLDAVLKSPEQVVVIREVVERIARGSSCSARLGVSVRG